MQSGIKSQRPKKIRNRQKGGADGDKVKQTRNKKWNLDENSALVHKSIARWDWLKGKFKYGRSGIEDRDKAWAEVTGMYSNKILYQNF